jgi:hypothetical protein
VGQHQTLLIFLTVLIVGIATAIGIQIFEESAIQTNRDSILQDLQVILDDANAYALRPESSGGGDGSFDGYVIPAGLAGDENGNYEIMVSNAKKKQKKGRLVLTGTSSKGYGLVRITVDDSLEIKNVTFEGEFK